MAVHPRAVEARLAPAHERMHRVKVFRPDRNPGNGNGCRAHTPTRSKAMPTHLPRRPHDRDIGGKPPSQDREVSIRLLRLALYLAILVTALASVF